MHTNTHAHTYINIRLGLTTAKSWSLNGKCWLKHTLIFLSPLPASNARSTGTLHTKYKYYICIYASVHTRELGHPHWC